MIEKHNFLQIMKISNFKFILGNFLGLMFCFCRYCKCEMPYNPDDLMVQCEICSDWLVREFHIYVSCFCVKKIKIKIKWKVLRYLQWSLFSMTPEILLFFKNDNESLYSRGLQIEYLFSFPSLGFCLIII